MTEVYTKPPPQTTASFARPERRGVSGRAVIEEAKTKVETAAFAEHLTGEGTRRGQELRFVCPLHDDHDPSLRVRPESGLWYCDPCAEGGDLITLAQRVWGIERADEAAGYVLLEFDHPIPERPATWYARQQRQKPVRNAIDAARFEQIRRRLYRKFMRPLVEGIEDDADQARDEQALWEATEPLARMLLDSVRGAR
jgi:hypothetical protein